MLNEVCLKNCTSGQVKKFNKFKLPHQMIRITDLVSLPDKKFFSLFLFLLLICRIRLNPGHRGVKLHA